MIIELYFTYFLNYKYMIIILIYSIIDAFNSFIVYTYTCKEGT